MAKSRYEEMIIAMTRQGWSQEEIDSYVANFNEIYEELCRSITTKASSLGRSGLEVNSVYLKSLGQLKNELAAVATEKIVANKPMVFFTDTDKGPQGDLLVALKNTTYLKNFLTDPKKRAINNGYPGVKIPLANKSKNVRQFEDYYAVGPKQLFCTLGKDGVKNIDEHIQYLTETAMASPKTRAVVSYGANMFKDLSNAAYLERALAEERADMQAGRVSSVSDYLQSYEGLQKYDLSRFLEDATDTLARGDVYYFGFVNGEPALDLGETVSGSMCDTKLYKSAKPLSVYAPDPYEPGKKVLNISENAFLRNDPKSGTCVVGLTRENLTMTGFGPMDDITKMLLSEHYTNTELANIEYRHQKIAAQRGLRPVVKKSATQAKAPTVKKPTQKTVEVVHKSNGTVPAFTPVKGKSRSINDQEGLLQDTCMAKANYALSQLQTTVKSDLSELDYFYLGELSVYVGNRLVKEVPAISFEKVSIYKNLVRQKIYEIVKQRVEETGVAELKFDKNGPAGDLKLALENAYEEYSAVFDGIPAVDFEGIKGFRMGRTQEEYDRPDAPRGDITISADGQVTARENANSLSKRQDDDRVQ